MNKRNFLKMIGSGIAGAIAGAVVLKEVFTKPVVTDVISDNPPLQDLKKKMDCIWRGIAKADQPDFILCTGDAYEEWQTWADIPIVDNGINSFSKAADMDYIHIGTS